MFRVQVWLTAALITTGVVGATAYNWPDAQPKLVDVETASVDDSELATPKTERGFSLTDQPSDLTKNPDQPLVENKWMPPLDTLEYGDRLLQVGNFVGAYDHFLKLTHSNDDASHNSSVVEIRLGLASELAGFLDRSEKHYRSAIRSQQTTKLDKAWALMGTARVWERQDRHDEAVSLLSELYLSYGSDAYPLEVRLPIERSLSDILLKQLLAMAQYDLPLQSLKGLEYYWYEAVVEPVISSTLRSQASGSETGSDHPLEVIQKPRLDASLIQIAATFEHKSLNLFLKELSQKTGLTIDLTEKAAKATSGRSARLAVENLSVSLVLDYLLKPLGLIWDQRGDVIGLMHESELPQKDRNDFASSQVLRLLHQIDLTSTSDDERIVALMHNGNVRLLRSEIEQGRLNLTAARNLLPRAELSAMLYFNQGLLEQIEGNRQAALDSFYQSLDQSLLARIRSTSYAKIAKLELELGRLEKAILAASRGSRLAGDSGTSSENLMVLAKSYLLSADPFSANRVLFNQAKSVPEQSKHLATVIASHARFQAMEPVNGLQSEGERLVLALAALTPSDTIDFVDHLIVSRAYADVGFGSKAIEHLDLAAAQSSGDYWGHRIRFELADRLYRVNDLENATDALNEIRLMSDEPLSIDVASLRARIQFDQAEYLSCEQTCRSLLALPLKDDAKLKTLELLGKTYQQTGKHYAAALCFAGLLPQSVTSDESELVSAETRMTNE